MNGTGVRFGVWATLGEPRTAAALEHAGFDWVALDQQHGHFDDRALRDTLALRTERRVPVLVRVGANDAALIGRALDAGADGVVVPLVDSPREAAAAVAAAHHPPVGTRSWGLLPGSGRSGAGPAAPFVAAMIETAEALGAAHAIAAVPGIDMVFVGPFDLSLRLGTTVDALLADRAPDAPLPRVLAAARDAGVLAGAFGADPARAAALVRLGFGWVALTTDDGLLAAGGHQRDLVARELEANRPLRR